MRLAKKQSLVGKIKLFWSISGIYRDSTCSTSLLYFLISKQEDVDDFHFLFED